MRTQKIGFVLTLLMVAGLSGSASAGDANCDNGYCNGDGEHCSWFADEYDHPGGTRQKYKYGKYWPPYARPVGCKEPYMHRYHRAHYWPYPYNCADRSAVRQVIDQQSYNGWMKYTTLYAYHFNPETQELNQSGRLNLRRIALCTPEKYRTAYVAAAMDPQDCEIRMANVTTALTTICGSEAGAPPIHLRVAQSIGTPAEEVYLIRGAYLQSTPAPRLPYLPYGATAPAAE